MNILITSLCQAINFIIKVIQADLRILQMAAMKNDTFKKIKKMIKDLTGLTPKNYHLIFKGKPCDDYLRLGALAINDGDVIHMVSNNKQMKHQN